MSEQRKLFNNIQDIICNFYEKSLFKNGFGVCLKDNCGIVLFQNNKCLGVYPHTIGTVCDKLCMQNKEKLEENNHIIIGIEHLLIHAEEASFEVVHLKDKDHIYTIYQNLNESIKEKLKIFQKYELTQSELKIVEEVLKGKNTQMILNTLFISKPTLRTHLNNIYKKIPRSLKKYLIEVRGNRKLSSNNKINQK